MVYVSNVLVAVAALSSASNVLAIPTGMAAGISARAPVKVTTNAASGDLSKMSGSAGRQYQMIAQQKADAQRKLNDAKAKEASMKKQVTNSYRKSEQQNAKTWQIRDLEELEARDPASTVVNFAAVQAAQDQATRDRQRWQQTQDEAATRARMLGQPVPHRLPPPALVKIPDVLAQYSPSESHANLWNKGRDLEDLESREPDLEDEELFARGPTAQWRGQAAVASQQAKQQEDMARQQMLSAQRKQQQAMQSSGSTYAKSNANLKKAFGRRDFEEEELVARARVSTGQWNGQSSAAFRQAKQQEDMARQQMQDAQRKQQQAMQVSGASYASTDAKLRKVFGRDYDEEVWN